MSASAPTPRDRPTQPAVSPQGSQQGLPQGSPQGPPAGPRRAVFPGTFDPVTLGHLDLVRRAAAVFDEVIVAPASHHDKRHLFSVGERVELLRAALADLPSVRVEPLSGLLVDGAARLGARTVVRGVRNANDLEYERQMAHTNRALAPWLDTVFLLSAPEHAHVSSTLVRQIARMGGDVRPFVPPAVADALARKPLVSPDGA
jgi:pantetheine-phosphate adenylyltransferase